MDRLRERLARIGSGKLLAALTLIGLAPVVIGFAVEDGFLPHVLAGLAGLILGAVLAVVLIEQLLQRRRKEQWRLAREEMISAICEALVEMAGSFALVLPGANHFLDFVGPEDDPVARPQIAQALQDLVGQTEAHYKALSLVVEDPDLASSRTVYDDAALALRMVDRATTRVIVLGDEPGLVKLMLALERAQQRWEQWLETVEQQGAPDRISWHQALLTIRAAADIYAYFVSDDEAAASDGNLPGVNDPSISAVNVIACYAAVTLVNPLLLWGGGALAGSLFGFSSHWRLGMFIAASVVLIAGLIAVEGRRATDLRSDLLASVAWLVLAFVAVPVLGLSIRPAAALASLAGLLFVFLLYVLLWASDAPTIALMSWLLIWTLLAGFFGFCAHRLVLFQ